MTGSMEYLLLALTPEAIAHRFHTQSGHEQLITMLWHLSPSHERAAVMLHEITSEMALEARK
jgi:hypothetical protein